MPTKFTGSEIAIIGMAGRFPGAPDLDTFWRNLENGVETMHRLSDDELESVGIPKEQTLDPNYVREVRILPDAFHFDANFFGMTPREAQLVDPQQRIFMEMVLEALQDSGYDPKASGELIGLYAGTGFNNYLSELLPSVFTGQLDMLEALTSNATDYLCTRVAYKLNLRGPAVCVQSACSTSLVAVHLACQALIAGECDVAAAGGIAVRTPQGMGYVYYEGGVNSRDGHIRSFDSKASGTVFGSGVGVVVLKRLSEALTSRDRILAVIKGSAINNDGSAKAGFTAPSESGQTEVIEEALAAADVDPASISYVEAHGTATAVGDPIEVRALNRAYGGGQAGSATCAIGSVKSNIGHMECAAGVTGLIKATMALDQRSIPPSINYEKPNPEIPFNEGPFFVNTERLDWPTQNAPRRAGVSAFGVGGTNAHVILEEAPEAPAPGPSRSAQLLLLSARSASALGTATRDLANHLAQNPEICLADVAYTLQVGRARHEHRRAVVCAGYDDALRNLSTPNPLTVMDRQETAQKRPVTFMFSGQGSQYVNMGRGLYEEEPSFRADVDHCADLLQVHLGLDLRNVMYPEPERQERANEMLAQTWLTQPSLFVVEYALARLWMSFGVTPQAMIGHSLGEYVAATLAGVFTLEDALRLVARRGRLTQDCLEGSMVSLEMLPEELRSILPDDLSIAAINGPAHCVVSGASDEMERFTELLHERDLAFRPLHISHAFHSVMVEPAMQDFSKEFESVKLSPPKLPLISNVTGRILSAEEATDPDYWVQHLRKPVLFADGVRQAAAASDTLLLEVGPGRTLATLAALQLDASRICTSLRHPKERQPDMPFFLGRIGELWTAGGEIDWKAFYANEERGRIPLPTYPFERQEYIAPHSGLMTMSLTRATLVHPLLGHITNQPPAAQYSLSLADEAPPYLDDHRVYDMSILPATAYLEMSFGAAKRIGWEDACLRDFRFEHACVLDEQARELHTAVVPEGDDAFSVRIFSSSSEPTKDNRWTLHARGTIERTKRQESRVDLEEIRSRCGEEFDAESVYGSMDAVGFHYGKTFRGLQTLWRGKGESLGRVHLSEELAQDAERYTMHPALLDACLHILSAAYPEGTGKGSYWPAGCGRFQVSRPVTREVWVHALGRLGSESGVLEMQIRLFDSDGNLLAELKDFQLRKIEQTVRAHTEDDPSDWLYSIKWEKLEELEPGDPTRLVPDSPWLILTDQRGLGSDLRQRFEALGEPCILLDREEDGVWKKLDAALSSETPPHGIVALWALDTKPEQDSAAEVVQGTLDAARIAQALLERSSDRPPPLWFVTRGAQVIGTNDDLAAPSQAPIWGLGRCIATEHGNLDTVLVDLDPESPQSNAAELIEILAASRSETQYAQRGGQYYVPRMLDYSPSFAAPAPLRILSDASYLITGGLGALGLATASYLVDQGARNLVLVGRSAPSDDAERELERFRTAGVNVVIASADMADFDEVRGVFDEIACNMPPLRGVVHSAGLIDDRNFMDQDPESFTKVMAPKIPGTWNLHRLTASMELDFFALFSSVSSIVGPPGQSNYAAANAYLDAMAYWRRQQGLPAVSMNWGAWAEIGLAARWQPSKALLGWPEMIPVKEGLELFERFLPGQEAQIAILPYYKETYAEWFAHSGGVPSLFKEVLKDLRVDPGGVAVVRYPRPDLVDEYVAARNATEKTLAEIWEAFLHVTPIGIDDNFFELGGNSLLAAQITTRLNAAFRVQLNVTALLESLTIARLAVVIEESQGSEGSTTIPLKPIDRSRPLPASLTQAILWSQAQIDGSFSIPVVHVITGPIDVPALQRSLNEIVERHETLRTELKNCDGELIQVVHPKTPVELSCVDLSDQPNERIRAFALQEIRRPFAGGAEPLLRANLIRVSGGRHILMIAVHHLVFDMVSIGILNREISLLYDAFSQGKESPLRPLPVQYGDYAVWQRRCFDSLGGADPDPEAEAGIRYWTRYLADGPIIQFPLDKPADSKYDIKFLFEALDTRVEKHLRGLALEERTTFFVVSLTAFQTLLAYHNQRTEEAVSIIGAGRHRQELESMIGSFFEPMTLRASFAGDPSFRSMVRQVREDLAEAMRHPVPVLKLIEAMPELAERALQGQRIVFQFVSTPAPLDLRGTEVSLSDEWGNLDSESPFDLCMVMLELAQGEGLGLSFGYNGLVLDDSTAKALIALYTRFVDLASSEPDRCIWDLVADAREAVQ